MTLRFKYTLSLLALVLASGLPVARADVEIELLTSSPGDSLWERFGHTALRVRSPGQDWVISFGAAPFSRPSFIWEFVRGRADFFAVARPFSSVIASYGTFNRTLQRQRLRLSREQKNALILRLREQLRPPNNRYRYDQLYDNCSTRIRDLIDDASEGALKRAAARHRTSESFRTLALYAGSGTWVGSIGFDLISGPHLDPPVTGWEEMFLPSALQERVAEAELSGARLADPPDTLLAREGPNACTGDLYGARRALLGLALFACFAGIVARQRKLRTLRWPRRVARLASSCALLTASVMGLLIVPMMLLSRVQVLQDNENGWLFWPLDVLWLRYVWSDAPLSRFARGYWLTRLACTLGVVALKLAGVGVQHNWELVALSCANVLGMAIAASFRRVRATRAGTVDDATKAAQPAYP